MNEPRSHAASVTRLTKVVIILLVLSTSVVSEYSYPERSDGRKMCLGNTGEDSCQPPHQHQKDLHDRVGNHQPVSLGDWPSEIIVPLDTAANNHSPVPDDIRPVGGSEGGHLLHQASRLVTALFARLRPVTAPEFLRGFLGSLAYSVVKVVGLSLLYLMEPGIVERWGPILG